MGNTSCGYNTASSPSKTITKKSRAFTLGDVKESSSAIRARFGTSSLTWYEMYSSKLEDTKTRLVAELNNQATQDNLDASKQAEASKRQMYSPVHRNNVHLFIYRQLKLFLRANVVLLQTIFDSYAPTGHGAKEKITNLTQEHCLVLVQDWLQALVEYLPRFISSAYGALFGYWRSWLNKYENSPSREPLATKQEALKAYSDAIKARMHDMDILVEDINRDLRVLVSNNIIASGIHLAMDVDHSGRVSREEFIDYFNPQSFDLLSRHLHLDNRLGRLYR